MLKAKSSEITTKKSLFKLLVLKLSLKVLILKTKFSKLLLKGKCQDLIRSMISLEIIFKNEIFRNYYL